MIKFIVFSALLSFNAFSQSNSNYERLVNYVGSHEFKVVKDVNFIKTKSIVDYYGEVVDLYDSEYFGSCKLTIALSPGEKFILKAGTTWVADFVYVTSDYALYSNGITFIFLKEKNDNTNVLLKVICNKELAATEFRNQIVPEAFVDHQ